MSTILAFFISLTMFTYSESFVNNENHIDDTQYENVTNHDIDVNVTNHDIDIN